MPDDKRFPKILLPLRISKNTGHETIHNAVALLVLLGAANRSSAQFSISRSPQRDIDTKAMDDTIKFHRTDSNNRFSVKLATKPSAVRSDAKAIPFRSTLRPCSI